MRTASSCEFTLVVVFLSIVPLLLDPAPVPLFAPMILPVQEAAPGSGLPGAAPCGTGENYLLLGFFIRATWLNIFAKVISKKRGKENL